MNTIDEGRLRFEFEANAAASKYDGWSFYRNQFQQGCARDNKAVDLLCASQGKAWLIEVKDYRAHPRTKAVDLAEEIAIKVRDTLAGLMAARLQANVLDERKFAARVLEARSLRVVCHIEQPPKTSRLRPRAIEPDKLKMKLRSLVKAVDPHPIVTDKSRRIVDCPWDVQERRDS